MVRHFKLTTQHRCEDPELESILNHLRYYRPSHKLLETLHENRVICSNNDPTNEQIASTLLQYPTATILTVTCAATNRINQIAVQTLYENEIPLCSVQCHCDLPPLPLYQDMAVVITQNRDKSNGVVNGQRASVYIVHRNTMFLKLPSGKIVNTYLVTRRKFDGSRKSTYPFVPAYALTICKSQGQTLPNVILWFDCTYVPAGAAYVALSRVRKLDNLRFLTETVPWQYTPVKLE